MPAVAAGRGGGRVLRYDQLIALAAPPMAAIFAMHYGPVWWFGLLPAAIGWVLARRVFVLTQELASRRR
jgi:hypothetical protein